MLFGRLKKKKKDVIWKDGKSIVTVISCENIGKNICTKIQWAWTHSLNVARSMVCKKNYWFNNINKFLKGNHWRVMMPQYIKYPKP